MTLIKLPNLEEQIRIAGRMVAKLYQIDVPMATQIIKEGVEVGDISESDLAEHVLNELKKEKENLEKNLQKEVE